MTNSFPSETSPSRASRHSDWGTATMPCAAQSASPPGASTGAPSSLRPRSTRLGCRLYVKSGSTAQMALCPSHQAWASACESNSWQECAPLQVGGGGGGGGEGRGDGGGGTGGGGGGGRGEGEGGGYGIRNTLRYISNPDPASGVPMSLPWHELWLIVPHAPSLSQISPITNGLLASHSGTTSYQLCGWSGHSFESTFIRQIPHSPLLSHSCAK